MMQGMLAMRSETLELPRHSFCSEYSGQCSVVALEVSEYRLNVMQVCGSYVSCVQGASSMSKIAAPAGMRAGEGAGVWACVRACVRACVPAGVCAVPVRACAPLCLQAFARERV